MESCDWTFYVKNTWDLITWFKKTKASWNCICMNKKIVKRESYILTTFTCLCHSSCKLQHHQPSETLHPGLCLFSLPNWQICSDLMVQKISLPIEAAVGSNFCRIWKSSGMCVADKTKAWHIPRSNSIHYFKCTRNSMGKYHKSKRCTGSKWWNVISKLYSTHILYEWLGVPTTQHNSPTKQ